MTLIGIVNFPFRQTCATIQRHMRMRWVTFDCFGTLVDWHGGFTSILAPLAGTRTAELIRAYHRFEREIEARRPHRLYADVLTSALKSAADEIGLTLNETESRALARNWGELNPFPDVEPMLAKLRAAGCRLGVLTNCDLALFEQTRRQFRQPFDLVVTAEEVKDYKPSLTHFSHFAKASGVDRSDWVHVACSWAHDIAPAREFGVKRIWLDRDLTGQDTGAASLRLTSTAGLAEAAIGLLEPA